MTNLKRLKEFRTYVLFEFSSCCWRQLPGLVFSWSRKCWWSTLGTQYPVRLGNRWRYQGISNSWLVWLNCQIRSGLRHVGLHDWPERMSRLRRGYYGLLPHLAVLRMMLIGSHAMWPSNGDNRFWSRRHGRIIRWDQGGCWFAGSPQMLVWLKRWVASML